MTKLLLLTIGTIAAVHAHAFRSNPYVDAPDRLLYWMPLLLLCAYLSSLAMAAAAVRVPLGPRIVTAYAGFVIVQTTSPFVWLGSVGDLTKAIAGAVCLAAAIAWLARAYWPTNRVSSVFVAVGGGLGTLALAGRFLLAYLSVHQSVGVGTSLTLVSATTAMLAAGGALIAVGLLVRHRTGGAAVAHMSRIFLGVGGALGVLALAGWLLQEYLSSQPSVGFQAYFTLTTATTALLVTGGFFAAMGLVARHRGPALASAAPA
jgi:hypothetical protein